MPSEDVRAGRAGVDLDAAPPRARAEPLPLDLAGGRMRARAELAPLAAIYIAPLLTRERDCIRREQLGSRLGRAQILRAVAPALLHLETADLDVLSALLGPASAGGAAELKWRGRSRRTRP